MFITLITGARNGAFFIAENREVIMRKVCAAILSAAICLAVSGVPAWA
ncbi:Ail/Lom family outer membrane beta-barrel protein, partial [Vibrio cholerae]|nr:Ail/Lom family outer membrane beta-barrel protein [Vibrio cholerae]